MRLVLFDKRQRLIATKRPGKMRPHRRRLIIGERQLGEPELGIGKVGGKHRLFAELLRERAEQLVSALGIGPGVGEIVLSGFDIGDPPHGASVPAQRDWVPRAFIQDLALKAEGLRIAIARLAVSALQAGDIAKRKRRLRARRFIQRMCEDGFGLPPRRLQITATSAEPGQGEAGGFIARIDAEHQIKRLRSTGIVPSSCETSRIARRFKIAMLGAGDQSIQDSTETRLISLRIEAGLIVIWGAHETSAFGEPSQTVTQCVLWRLRRAPNP